MGMQEEDISNKYDKIITNMNRSIINEFQNQINIMFKPLIHELKNDCSEIKETKNINEIIKNFPIYKELEYKYEKLLEENVSLKKEITNINKKYNSISNEIENKIIKKNNNEIVKREDDLEDHEG